MASTLEAVRLMSREEAISCQLQLGMRGLVLLFQCNELEAQAIAGKSPFPRQADR